MTSKNFNYYIPTRIIFGAGRLKELAELPMPGTKALVVISAGGSIRKNGYLDRVEKYLAQAGAESVVFDKIQPNPVSEHVMEGAALAKAEGCDFVVGLGGGSSMDSAKSIAMMAKNPGDYWDYMGGSTGGSKPVENGALPIICITTTAGTGTEADPWTVITKTETQEKLGFGCDATFPLFSIVDPELMLSVPPQLTAFQGMDAFFHASEGYLASISQPASDLYSLESIKLVKQNLPTAVRDGSNLDARTAVAWANTLSGMVESTSCVISQHSLEHSLSAFYPALPHGGGLVLLSIAYFSFMAQHTPHPERFADMARAMGVDVDALPETERAMAFVESLRELIADIGLAGLRLQDYGIGKDESEKLAKHAKANVPDLFDLDPVKLSLEDIVGIYEAAFGN